MVQSALTQLVEDRHVDWTEAARAGVIGGVTGGLVEGISIAASAESLSAFNRRQNDPVGRHDNLLQNGFNSFVNSALSAKVGDALYDAPQYDTGRDTFRSIAINAFGSAAGNSFTNQFEYIQKARQENQAADEALHIENLLGIDNPFAVAEQGNFLGDTFAGPLSVRQRELKTLVDAGVMTPKAAFEFDMEESDELANVPFGIRAPQGSDLRNEDGGMLLAALEPQGINTPAERILTLGPVMHPDADSYLMDDNKLGESVDTNEDGFLSTAERYLSNTGTTLEHTSDPAREMFGELMYAIKEDLGMSALADGVVALGNSLVDSAILFGEQLEYIATMGYSGRPTTLDAILDLERMGSQKVASIYNAVVDGDPARIGDELSPLYTMALTGEAGIFARYGIGRVGEGVPDSEPILFGQRRVSPNFSNDPKFPATSGKSINQVVDELLDPNNPLSADDLPITAFRDPASGQLVSANTRTRATLAKAGIEPTKVDIIDIEALPKRQRASLLRRLTEQPVLENNILPSTKVPVTPTTRDLNILEIIEIQNKAR